MGLGGISIWQLLIVLAIVLLIFGPKRIRNLGSELGGALKGFRKEMKDDTEETPPPLSDDKVIDSTAEADSTTANKTTEEQSKQ